MLIKNGSRKYLNSFERRAFINYSETLSDKDAIFCRILCETGCRISEALNLTFSQIDLQNKSIRFETLKKRKVGVYRSVPISDSFIRKITRFCRTDGWPNGDNIKIWNMSRMTAYRLVVRVMNESGIYGRHAMPRGLRHGFAVAALEAGVPITLVQRWLGHANLKATAIYTEVVGVEERAIASRMWRRRRGPPASAQSAYSLQNSSACKMAPH